MKEILDTIELALERKGLSAAAASRLAVGNPSLIKNMRAGASVSKRFNSLALQKLAAVLDLEFYFGEKRGSMLLRMPSGYAEETVEPLSGAAARQEALEMGFLPVPYHLAAAPDFRGTAPVALARGWLRASGLTPETLAFLPVVTDAMSPTLRIGCLALIDTAQTDGSGGHIWAISIKGAYEFARMQQPNPDMLILKGDAPNHPVRVFKGHEWAAIEPLGRVVWIAHQPE